MCVKIELAMTRIKQEGNLLGGLRYLSILILSDNISSILVNSG